MRVTNKISFVVIFLLAVPLISFGTSYGPTDFPLAENPIFEGGKWQVPGSVASQWGNVQTGSSMAYGVSQPTQYGDATAILSGVGTWGPDETAQATVKIPGSAPSGCCSEVSLRLRMTISSNNIRGYEILCPVWGSPNYGFQIVRWNGPNAQFVYLPTTGTGANQTHQCVNNDTIKATITGSNPVSINVYYNGGTTPYISATDNGSAYNGPGGAAGPWTSGSPGLGFCCQGSPFSFFGLTNFTATDGSSVAPSVNAPTGLAVVVQ